jgi:hypothetical protein
MGSMSEAKPSASRLARADSRPILVSVLVVGWVLLSAFGGLRALVVLGNAAATSRLGDTDPMARAAAAAPDLVTDETRQLLAQREKRMSLERNLAGPLLLVSALGVVGAIGLLRRRPWSRAVLVSVGVLALGLSVFHATRSVRILAAPAVGLAEDPDAQNAVALLRAAAGIGLALQSIPLIVAMALLRHPIVRDYVSAPGKRGTQAGKRPATLLIVAGSAVLIGAVAVFLSKSRSHAPPPEKGVSGVSASEPSETFRWSEQPISFSPPAAHWKRERHAEGGRKGVSFTRYEAPPSRVIVAEAAVETAPTAAEEILPKFRLTRERFSSADSVTVGEPMRAVVAGLPAFQTDYTLRERSMQHRGREFFTVAGGHAFVFTFLGRDTDLPVLENLVASVRFPAGGEGGDAPLTTTEEPPREAPKGGDVAELRVGEHRVTIRVPRDWEHIDYGQRQEFRHGEARIVLVDAGRVETAGTGREIDDERVIERARRLFDHDLKRWEISAKTRIRVGPQEALAVDTWEPLSHVFHNRTILFVNAGRLLVAGTAQGTAEETKGPLDALARSIRFSD